MLVVDDDPFIQRVIPEILKLALAQSGMGEYEIVMAENGLKALEAYDESVKLIFTDFEMPEMNGP